MKKTITWFCSLMIFFVIGNKISAAYAVDDSIKHIVKLNLNVEYQSIENFGASDCWTAKFIGQWKNEEKKNRIADYLFSTDTLANGQPKGIGLTMWRFNIGGGSIEQGGASNIKDEYRREECFLDTDGTYNWSKQQGQQWFLNAAKQRGLNNFLAFSITPPVQFTIDGKAHGRNANLNLKKGKEHAYADFMVKVVKHFNEQGYHMPFLSPFNEPQWNWGEKKTTQEGTAATNREMADFIKILGPKLNGTKVKIALGEAAQWNFLNSSYNNGRGNQLKDFFSQESDNYVGNVPNLAPLFSAHSYFTTCPDSSLIKVRQEVMKAKKLYAPAIKLWQTEFGILGDICKVYNGSPRNTGIDYGLYIAKVIHHDLTITNVAAWHWWLAINPYNYSDGLVYINDLDGGHNLNDIKMDGLVSDSKQLWCFGNYSRFVRPGMVRVEASIPSSTSMQNAAETQMVSAYKDKLLKKVVLVIINMENSEKNMALEVSLQLRKRTLTGYLTDSKQNLSKVEVSADAISLPAKSVLTLLCDYI